MELFEICTSTVYQFCPSFLTEYSKSSVILMCCLMICSCSTKTYQPCFKDLLRWACSTVILLSLLKVKSLIAFLKSDSLIFLFPMFFIWITGNNSPLTQWPTKFGKKKVLSETKWNVFDVESRLWCQFCFHSHKPCKKW